MSLGMEIRIRRVAAGMKQKELAEKLGVKQGKISAYELGLLKPSIEKVIQMSEIFGCSTDALLKGEIQKIFRPDVSGT